MTERTRVVIADDHPLYREGVRRALAWSGTIEVVGEASNGREALKMIKDLAPDVALVDFRMPDMDGIALTRSVAQWKLETRVVIVSAFQNSELVFRALEEGAAGYMLKDAKRTELVEAVRQAAAGKTVIPAELAGGVADEIRMRAQSGGPVFTSRELEVLRDFAEGMSIPQIAQKLFLAPSTIKTHAQHLYEKLGVGDRAAAVAEGMRRGLLD
ncbi:response regulator [Streptomyces sp. NBC_01264]|uniref:response regulator n=1 Tax=Streptomyces sp. NBC_01264 TaxID=2903804 RepID=UPI00225209AD|nr:response regulator transcription factor [Streptomyces sp. NBC_01264]MCX4781769.1 response regulator transcription factor [Streptomyces sp. NBC_01264]